jgi:hypothetical protein
MKIPYSLAFEDAFQPFHKLPSEMKSEHGYIFNCFEWIAAVCGWNL